MSSKREPAWLSLLEILAVHEQLIAIFGGSSGIRDQGLIESALSRPKKAWAYEKADLFSMAALYADGIINNHPFIDGNKRTGFVAAALFLETNGCSFHGTEEEVVAMTLGLADKSVSKGQYEEWLRRSSKSSGSRLPGK